jgi:hypothetical protein
LQMFKEWRFDRQDIHAVRICWRKGWHVAKPQRVTGPTPRTTHTGSSATSSGQITSCSNLNEFLGYFMVRKVIAGKDLLRAAGTTTKKLVACLAENGYAAKNEAEDAIGRDGRAAQDLPKPRSWPRTCVISPSTRIGEMKITRSRIFTLTRDERGKIWLEGALDGRDLGLIAMPEEISRRCKVGWTISGVVGRLDSGGSSSRPGTCTHDKRT